MNNWLKKNERRVAFNTLKTCTCCLFNNNEESFYCDIDISMIWNFKTSFFWLGWRMYNPFSNSLLYEEFFDVEYVGNLGGSVEINLHKFTFANIKFGELFSEFN